MNEKAPRCIVLGGINGAGKTTSARTILAETLRVMTFVNADVIAQGLAGFDPDNANLEAGRIMLNRLHVLAERREDFAFETTMSGRTSALWLGTLRRWAIPSNLPEMRQEPSQSLKMRLPGREFSLEGQK